MGNRLRLLVVLLAGLGPSAHAFAPEEVGGLERYVDAYAPEGGDGSQLQPFRRLGLALEAGPRAPRVIHLATGLYEGPFELPPGVRLVGGSAVVLHAKGSTAAVLRAKGEAHLERLHVQGGRVGLLAEGRVELSSVNFSGQRKVALALAPGAEALVRKGLFQGTVSETVGLQVPQGATATVEEVLFTGAFRRGLEVQGGNVVLLSCRFEGLATALHLVGGTARLARVSVWGGRGPALFISGGRLEARQVDVEGHEYALQASGGAEIDVEDLISIRAERAAVALTGARARMVDVVVKDAGSFGGLQSLSSELTLFRLRVFGASGSGLLAREGKLLLQDAAFFAVRADGASGGDAIELRGVAARIEDLIAVDLAGSGVLASMSANVTLQGLVCERCRFGGLMVERGSEVVARDLEILSSEGAAVAVMDGGKLLLRNLRSRNNPQGPLWAECSSGAQVQLEPAFEPAGFRLGPCVLWRNAPR